MSNPPLNLPSRLRESSFREYEADIAKIVNAYPNVVVFTPTRNVITYVARLRDAILSYKTYDWDSTIINPAMFRAIHNVIVVSHKGTEVVAGSRERVRFYGKPVNLDATLNTLAGQSPQVELNDLSGNEIRFLCLLASKRLLTNPIRTGCMNVEDKTLLENNFDVMIENNNDGTFTII